MVQQQRRSSRVQGILHQLGALLTLPDQARAATGVEGRRQRQRLAMAQRLLDPLPMAFQGRSEATTFWKLLRFGGIGLWLAWVLKP